MSAAYTVESTESGLRDLIAAHIAARHQFNHVLDREDWGMATTADVDDASGQVNETLLVLCRARPSSSEELAMWKQYLLDYLPFAFADDAEIMHAALTALLERGGS